MRHKRLLLSGRRYFAARHHLVKGKTSSKLRSLDLDDHPACDYQYLLYQSRGWRHRQLVRFQRNNSRCLPRLSATRRRREAPRQLLRLSPSSKSSVLSSSRTANTIRPFERSCRRGRDQTGHSLAAELEPRRETAFLHEGSEKTRDRKNWRICQPWRACFRSRNPLQEEPPPVLLCCPWCF